MKKFILIISILISTFSFAQTEEGQVFTKEDFLRILRDYHPVAKQADLLIEQGERTVQSARGGFDPKIGGTVDQKYYDDKSYYRLFDGGLKIPTWYGVELKTGIEQNTGQFLNPENNVPNNGLWYGGISVPVGKGLFIDERRSELRKAQLFVDASLAEREKMLNELYFEAINEYWKWTQMWNQLQIYEEMVELARIRLEAVKGGFELGDQPAVDTLEAFIQMQNRQMMEYDFRLKYEQSTLKLSNYLWFEDNAPLEITPDLRPPNIDEINNLDVVRVDSVNNMIANLSQQHPEMRLVDYQLKVYDIERRMNAESLKPEINLNYNALSEPVGDILPNDILLNNYKWGLDVSFPIFLRKERGKLALNKIKIMDKQYDQQQKLLSLQNNVRNYYVQQNNLRDQITLYRDAVNNYGRLLQAEREKFDLGESSLFLINSRERMYIQVRLKLAELVSKFNISKSGLQYAGGVLHENS